MKRALSVFCWTVVLAVVVAGCHARIDDRLAVNETSLGRCHGGDDGPEKVSPNGWHVAFVARQGAKQVVMVDGKPGPAYDRVWPNTLQFSQDGLRVAYVAGLGDKRLVVVDGKAGPSFDGIGMVGGDVSVNHPECRPMRSDKQLTASRKQTSSAEGQKATPGETLYCQPFFSPDSRRFAYVAHQESKWFVVVDGEPGPPFDGIGEYSLVCSADSRHVGYVGISGRKQRVVIDGKLGPVYDGIGLGSPIFSPDGRRVAYSAQSGGRWFVVVDGKPGPLYDRVDDFVFSPDSRRVGYVARKGGKEIVVVDGKPRGHGWFVGLQVSFSPDSRHWYCVEQLNIADGLGGPTSDRIVVDGKPGPVFGGTYAGEPAYSPDGRHLAYYASQNGKELVVVDGKPGQAFDKIELPILGLDDRLFSLDKRFPIPPETVFSPDGRHFAYKAKQAEKWFVVEDGKPGSAFDEIDIDSPYFSQDGRHLAYEAKRGEEWFLVLDGKAGPPFKWFGINHPAFSPDGKHIAYKAYEGGHWRLMVDGRFGPAYDDNIIGETPIVFDSPTTLHTLIAHGNTIYRLQVTIKE